MYMKGYDLSLNWRFLDLCLYVMYFYLLFFYVYGYVFNIYIYIVMLIFWFLKVWYFSFIYRYLNLYSWLNYYCIELLFDIDSDIIFIYLLVFKIILYICYILNEWMLWWINFFDCVILYGCIVYIYCL